MKDTIKFSELCLFPNNIADITSISMECNYQCEENKVFGEFIIEGTYRAYELSINQDNFSYKLPFEYLFASKINDESALVTINDFTYEFDNKELKVDIEYEVSADMIEEEDRDIELDEEFERFIIDNDVEVVDFGEPDKVEENIERKEENDENREIEEITEQIEEEPEIIENEESNAKITNTIINNIRTNEDDYITYHIYICTENDTIDSISNKFKISVDILKMYNDIDTIKVGTKLIIPGIDE